jgi:mono/diheme cytochrome c family protein
MLKNPPVESCLFSLTLTLSDSPPHEDYLSKKIFMKKCVLLLIPAALWLLNCQNDSIAEPNEPAAPAGTSKIYASNQRPGNAVAGYEYLVYGDYVSAGIPLGIFKLTLGDNSSEDLERTGDNDGIPFNYTVVKAASGAKVVAPNCLNCHAERLNGKLILGLGNNTTDYTTDQSEPFKLADPIVKLAYGENSPEWEAYHPASLSAKAIGPYIVTKTKGVNPADKIFAALSAHRQATDLTWLDDAQFAIPQEVVPTDVPAWWLMKKKNALYYNALGVGDFGRLSMASGLLTMKDSTEARRIDQKFADVMAYVRSIEPPAYPYPIDQALAQHGEALFQQHCEKCHGSYGNVESYPNLLVDLPTIGTDPALADLYAAHPQYHDWYNGSWFAKDPDKAKLLPTRGYVAPPLDGIWATAPYLHNGSVPTLDDLLHSLQRPAFWRRNFDNSDFDKEKMGWKYERLDKKEGKETYDTTQQGYGNMGHTFGDVLTKEERQAVLEYLKTL